MAAEFRFNFYELVDILRTEHTVRLAIVGMRAAVLGRAESIQDGEETYSVHVYDRGSVFSVSATDLRHTGLMTTRDEFFSGASLQVSPQGEVRHEDN